MSAAAQYMLPLFTRWRLPTLSGTGAFEAPTGTGVYTDACGAYCEYHTTVSISGSDNSVPRLSWLAELGGADWPSTLPPATTQYDDAVRIMEIPRSYLPLRMVSMFTPSSGRPSSVYTSIVSYAS